MDDLGLILEGLDLKRLSTTPQGYKMVCPYHDDHDPSGKISVEKKIFKCFSCGTFRPLFDFLLDQGASFEQAVDYAFTESEWEKKEHTELREYRLGRKLPKSMLDRGFTPETLQHFKVGYDEKEKRTTIPLYKDNRLVGIKFRRYPKGFWYSDGFVRDDYIYNDGRSKDRIVVESETDLWNAFQMGTENVSATLGAQVTERQAEILSKHDRLFLAFDNDPAGFAAVRKINDYLKYDCEIYVVPYLAEDVGAIQDVMVWDTALNNLKTITEWEIIMDKIEASKEK